MPRSKESGKTLLDPADVLVNARSLANRVMDKNIALSEQARELISEINEVLGDVPSLEEVQRIFAAIKDRPE